MTKKKDRLLETGWRAGWYRDGYREATNRAVKILERRYDILEDMKKEDEFKDKITIDSIENTQEVLDQAIKEIKNEQT